ALEPGAGAALGGAAPPRGGGADEAPPPLPLSAVRSPTLSPTSLSVSRPVGRGEELAGQRDTGAGDVPAVGLTAERDGCASAHDSHRPPRTARQPIVVRDR